VKYWSISSIFAYMYSKVDTCSSSVGWYIVEAPTVIPVHWKIWRSLQGMSSSTWYRIVGVLTLWCYVKYTLVKYAISFNLNSSAMQPSTLALLWTITLRFFKTLSMWYIHLYYCGPPNLASYGRCTSKCCIGLNHPGENIFFNLHISIGISSSNFSIISFLILLAYSCL
jgi:hypothetical protein